MKQILLRQNRITTSSSYSFSYKFTNVRSYFSGKLFLTQTGQPRESSSSSSFTSSPSLFFFSILFLSFKRKDKTPMAFLSFHLRGTPLPLNVSEPFEPFSFFHSPLPQSYRRTSRRIFAINDHLEESVPKTYQELS